MTKYTFSPKNNPSTIYCPFYKSTDYSKILDDAINADIIDKNPWLYTTSYNSSTATTPKIKIKINNKPYSDDLESAFLFGDKKYYFSDAYNFFKNLPIGPFEKNVKYKLSNGDIIIITDDYIHINDEMYFFNLINTDFYTKLNSSLKKTIATIYVDGLKITIKK